MTMTPQEAYAEAVRKIGGPAAVARLIGVTPQAVSRRLQLGQHATAEWVLKLEKASGVTKELLRPDIYPPATEE